MAKIEIPNFWNGKPITGALERLVAKPTNPTLQPDPVIVSNSTTTLSNPRDYIVVPQYNVLIAKAEIHKGKNWSEALDALGAEGLMMPTIGQFMRHWSNVKNAVVDRTNVLVYADGANVPYPEALDLWNYMSRHKNGCHTWLNAKFLEDRGKWKMVQKYNGQKDVELDLDCPIRQDGFVDVEFNTQGFPERKSSLTSYIQGENIYFWHPRNNMVARFGAGSGGAVLVCSEGPSVRGSRLGVFACVAGIAPQNSGGSP